MMAYKREKVEKAKADLESALDYQARLNHECRMSVQECIREVAAAQVRLNQAVSRVPIAVEEAEDIVRRAEARLEEGLIGAAGFEFSVIPITPTQ